MNVFTLDRQNKWMTTMKPSLVLITMTAGSEIKPLKVVFKERNLYLIVRSKSNMYRINTDISYPLGMMLHQLKNVAMYVNYYEF
jgi:hypothetical protein